MENLINHARRMVSESDMGDDAKMEVLDFLNIDDVLALREYRKLGTIEGINMLKEKLDNIRYVVEEKEYSDGAECDYGNGGSCDLALCYQDIVKILNEKHNENLGG